MVSGPSVALQAKYLQEHNFVALQKLWAADYALAWKRWAAHLPLTAHQSDLVAHTVEMAEREHRLRTLPSCPRDDRAGKRCVAGRHLRCRIRAEHRAGQPRPLADVPGTRRRRRGLFPFAPAFGSLRGGPRGRRTAAAEDLRRRLLAHSPNGICTRARSTEVVKKAFDPRRVAPPH